MLGEDLESLLRSRHRHDVESLVLEQPALHLAGDEGVLHQEHAEPNPALHGHRHGRRLLLVVAKPAGGEDRHRLAGGEQGHGGVERRGGNRMGEGAHQDLLHTLHLFDDEIPRRSRRLDLEQDRFLDGLLVQHGGEPQDGDQPFSFSARGRQPRQPLPLPLEQVPGRQAVDAGHGAAQQRQPRETHPHHHHPLAAARRGYHHMHAGPGTRRGIEPDLATQPAHRPAHGIETDTTAGDFGDALPGRKTRPQHELQRLLRRRLGARRQQAHLPGRLHHGCGVDPFAVVLDGDLDPVSDTAGDDAQQTAHRLAALAPHRRRLDAVVDGVAHEVEEGAVELGADATVEPRLTPLEHHLDLLAEALRELPSVARQAEEERAQGLQLQRQQRVELLLGALQQATLVALELCGGAPQRGGEHRQHLVGLRLEDAPLGELGELLDPLGEGETGEGADPQVDGAGREGIGHAGRDSVVVADGIGRLAGLVAAAAGHRPLLARRRRRPGCRFGVFVHRRRALPPTRLSSSPPAARSIRTRRRGGRCRRSGKGARHPFEQSAQLVEKLRHLLAGPDADDVEQLLPAVAEVGHRAELEHAARALERVQLTARLDHRRHRALELRRQRQQPLDALARLTEEERHEVEQLVVQRVGSRVRSGAAAAPVGAGRRRAGSDADPAPYVDVGAEHPQGHPVRARHRRRDGETRLAGEQ